MYVRIHGFSDLPAICTPALQTTSAIHPQTRKYLYRVFVCIYTCIYISMHVCVCIHIYMCVCVWVRVCVGVYCRCGLPHWRTIGRQLGGSRPFCRSFSELLKFSTAVVSYAVNRIEQRAHVCGYKEAKTHGIPYKLQVSFRKRAINCRALLFDMTHGEVL